MYRKIWCLTMIPVLEPDLSNVERHHLISAYDSGWISSKGSYIDLFEDEFSKLHLNRCAVSVCNGTTALHLAMLSLGVGMGDEVIVPNLTFGATVNAVLHCNATPIFCDVSLQDWNLDVSAVASAITPRTKAIIAVHLYGVPCDIESLRSLADAHSLLLIEDCAEALGAQISGVPIGTFGDAATFSFFGNKHITTGEGGMVLFKDTSHKDFAKVLRDHGMSPQTRYLHVEVGYNYRLTNIQASIGYAQLTRLKEILLKKKWVFDTYTQLFKERKIKFTAQHVDKSKLSSYWLNAFMFEGVVDIERLSYNLRQASVETRRIFSPMNRQPAFVSSSNAARLFENSDSIFNAGICLPSSSTLSEDEISTVVDVLHGSLPHV